MCNLHSYTAVFITTASATAASLAAMVSSFPLRSRNGGHLVLLNLLTVISGYSQYTAFYYIFIFKTQIRELSVW